VHFTSFCLADEVEPDVLVLQPDNVAAHGVTLAILTKGKMFFLWRIWENNMLQMNNHKT
jgi:hypothetical protein